MKKISTYFWEPDLNKSHLRKLLHSHLYKHHLFTNGNAGDIFCKDIINYYYPNLKIINSNKKNRILIIGSLIHNLQSGDLICGVGIKNFNLNFCPNVQIKGIRGYRTYEFLKKKKFDLTNLSFISDPGLIISKIFNVTRKKKDRGLGFIPHYTRLPFYKSNSLYKVISIDQEPKNLIEEISNYSLIVSSSLHGIIFAHSLNIPAIYFNELNEPESIKFLDYFSTIEKKVISIDKLSDLKTIIYPDSAPEVAHLISSINFPKHADLSAKKIIY